MDSPLWIYLLGIFAQSLVGVRVLVQWIASERAGKVLSPGAYWVLSMAASLLMMVYGWLRKDLAIIAGEWVVYFIYMWNVGAKGLFRGWPKWATGVLIALPALLLLGGWISEGEFGPLLSDMGGVTGPLLVLGLTGQAVYKSRLVYQIVYSVRRGESLLPPGFWILAVCGSLLLIVYALIRHDWALLLGQFGIFIAARNLMIHYSGKKPGSKKTDSNVL